MKRRKNGYYPVPKTIRLPSERRNGDAVRWLDSIVHRLIERRAQEIFLQQNSAPNRDMENWLQAEAEMQRVLEQTEVSLKLAFETGIARNRCRN